MTLFRRIRAERLDQVVHLTRARLRARYRGTFAGVVWVALSPISLYLVQATVFGHLFSTTVKAYPLFLLSGLFPWFFLAQTLEMGGGLFLQNGPLLKSLQLHPGVLVAALTLDNAINFLFTMGAVAAVCLFTTHEWHWGALLLPLPALVLSIFVFALTYLLAIVNVFLRDARFVVSFGLQVLFFLTPIFYPAMIDIAVLRAAARFNPVSYLLAPFRCCLWSFEPRLFAVTLLEAAALSACATALAWVCWRRSKNALYFRI